MAPYSPPNPAEAPAPSSSSCSPWGIDYKHYRPYHPQTCGRVEPVHQTLKKWLARQRKAKTVTQLHPALPVQTSPPRRRPPPRRHRRHAPRRRGGVLAVANPQLMRGGPAFVVEGAPKDQDRTDPRRACGMDSGQSRVSRLPPTTTGHRRLAVRPRSVADNRTTYSSALTMHRAGAAALTRAQIDGSDVMTSPAPKSGRPSRAVGSVDGSESGGAHVRTCHDG